MFPSLQATSRSTPFRFAGGRFQANRNSNFLPHNIELLLGLPNHLGENVEYIQSLNA
jgi:hypothetical protein